MSVTSSATALRDQEVPSPDSFRDKLLVVSITKGDGTPLDASSITEEDIVEICVRGHTLVHWVCSSFPQQSQLFCLEMSQM